jgi:hypothetical protein
VADVYHWGTFTVFNDATGAVMLRDAALPDGSARRSYGTLYVAPQGYYSADFIDAQLWAADTYVEQCRRLTAMNAALRLPRVRPRLRVIK